MKKIYLLKCAAAMLCCIFALTFTSCKKKVKFSSTKVEVNVGATTTVNVKKGAAPFTPTSSDKSVATVTAKGKVISVTGVKAGNATITVVDKKKRTGKFNVTVKDAGKDKSAGMAPCDNTVTLTAEEGECGELIFVKE